MNYYKILGVPKDATAAQIKKAFRDLSKEHHPDKGGDAEKFNTIKEAYDVLSDPAKRQEFDETGSVNKKRSQGQAMLVMLIDNTLIPMMVQFHDKPFNALEQFIQQMKDKHEQGKLMIKEKDDRIEQLQKVSGRITTTGDNIVQGIIDGKIKELEAMKLKLEAEMLCLDWCIDQMKAYKYEVTQQIGDEDEVRFSFGGFGDLGGSHIDFGSFM